MTQIYLTKKTDLIIRENKSIAVNEHYSTGYRNMAQEEAEKLLK